MIMCAIKKQNGNCDLLFPFLLFRKVTLSHLLKSKSDGFAGYGLTGRYAYLPALLCAQSKYATLNTVF